MLSYTSQGRRGALGGPAWCPLNWTDHVAQQLLVARSIQRVAHFKGGLLLLLADANLGLWPGPQSPPLRRPSPCVA